MLSPIIRYIRDWQRYGRDVQELSRLSDRELADIGISRCESRSRLSKNSARAELLWTSIRLNATLAHHKDHAGQRWRRSCSLAFALFATPVVARQRPGA
jgi:uncharacterized protein YjiS (DUF1127 family)